MRNYKRNVTIVSNEIDYEKLAEAIVKAQSNEKEIKKDTGKLRSSAMSFLNGAMYSTVYIVSGLFIYTVWTELHHKHNECSKAQREEYEKLRKAMSESLNNCEIIIENFNYKPEQSEIFYNYAISNKSKLSVKGAFAKNLDIEKLAEMFRKSTSEQMDNIREAILAVYRDDNVKLYLANDIESIAKLLEIIKNWPSEKVGDKIQQQQHKWFIKNLEDIMKKLS